jgi:hypothetical protein
MGWLFNTIPGGLANLLDGRRKGWEFTRADGSQGSVKLLASCFRGAPTHGGSFWKLYETTVTNADGAEVEPKVRWIALDLLKCHGGCWGYKDLDETMGPCELNCPISYIERATEPSNEYARQWRKDVLEAYAESGRGRKLAVGRDLPAQAEQPQAQAGHTALAQAPARRQRPG